MGPKIAKALLLFSGLQFLFKFVKAKEVSCYPNFSIQIQNKMVALLVSNVFIWDQVGHNTFDIISEISAKITSHNNIKLLLLVLIVDYQNIC